jgi:hypothetical protein
MQIKPQRPFKTLDAFDVHLFTQITSTPTSWVTKWTKGDGNCMFRAFAKAYQSGQYSHEDVREGAVHYIRTHEVDFVHFIENSSGHGHAFRNYLDRMERDKEWGDHLMLEAMCQYYKAHVFVLSVNVIGGQSWAEVGTLVDAVSSFWLYHKDNHYENLLSGSQLLCN